MDAKEAKIRLEEVAKEKIRSVLVKDVWAQDLSGLISPDQAHGTLMGEGAASCEDLDTNGWANDFSLHFTHRQDRYLLSGSGWYGRLKFERLMTEGAKRAQDMFDKEFFDILDAIAEADLAAGDR